LKRLIVIALLLLFMVPGVQADPGLDTMNYKDYAYFLSENLGKPLLVNFWATWCPPCLRELPGLLNLRKKYGEDKLHMIGISLDYNRMNLVNFLGKVKFGYPICLALPDLPAQLRLRSIPKTILYDRNGKEVLNYEGFMPMERMDLWIQKAIEAK